MKYKSGDRIFIVDSTDTDQNGYLKVTDFDTKVVFRLPKFVIDGFTYVFSWDRYREERDNAKVLTVLEDELSRLRKLNLTHNIKVGIKQIEGFIKDISFLSHNKI